MKIDRWFFQGPFKIIVKCTLSVSLKNIGVSAGKLSRLPPLPEYITGKGAFIHEGKREIRWVYLLKNWSSGLRSEQPLRLWLDLIIGSAKCKERKMKPKESPKVRFGAFPGKWNEYMTKADLLDHHINLHSHEIIPGRWLGNRSKIHKRIFLRFACGFFLGLSIIGMWLLQRWRWGPLRWMGIAEKFNCAY